MKKTLTVNLGGTVYQIDEDAYLLLDEYLSNLKSHFGKREGADEIVKDIEGRIAELFSEKVKAGYQVITIEYVEEVINRVGKPEELDEETGNEQGKPISGFSTRNDFNEQIRRRLYRDPDNKILGGVASGLAAYFGWDVTWVRLAMIILLFIPYCPIVLIYIICWIVLPPARTAAEKLAMKGENITVENIGKTVTDGFEKVANEVNDYMNSGRPRTFLQKLGDLFVQIVGIALKVLLVIVAIIFSPILFILAIILIALMGAAIGILAGGGAAFYHFLSMADWDVAAFSPGLMVVTCITGVLFVGIPLVGLIHAIFRQLFNWRPMSAGAKWTLLVLWILSLAAAIVLFSHLNIYFPEWYGGMRHIGIS